MGRTSVEPARDNNPALAPAALGQQGAVAAIIWNPHAGAMAIVLVILVAVAFAPCLGNDFVSWDDEANFLENPCYRGLGWSQIRWAWTSFHLGVYQPLAWMILETQFLFFGLQPWGYHLTSLILHALNTVVLFVLTVSVLAQCRPESGCDDPRVLTLAAGLAAALHVVHPLRTEVVAWASCQPYLPCSLFFMLAILAYLRASGHDGWPGRGWLVISWILFAGALLCKAVAVTLPAVLCILDVYPLRRLEGRPSRWFSPSASRVWCEKVPFVVLSAIFMVLAVRARVHEQDPLHLQDWSLASRTIQSCSVVGFYVLKTIVPTNLTAYYPVPEQLELLDLRFLRNLAGAVCITAIVFRLRRRWPGLLAAWLSYLVILAPNLGLIRTGIELSADRYSYLAMTVGPILMAAGFCRLWPVARRVRPLVLLLAAASLGALVVLIILTRAQCRTWQTTETLLTHALTHGSENSSVLLNNLGLVRFRQGRLAEARALYLQALRLDPDDVEARCNLGTVLSRQGRLEEAGAQFSEALRFNPGHPLARSNLGVILLRQGKLDEALTQCARAERLNPGNADVRNSLGAVLLTLGRFREARVHFVEALRLDPGHSLAHANLGVLRMRQGRLEESRTHPGQGLPLRHPGNLH